VDIPPLKGVECPYCKGSPHFQWHKTIPLAEIKEKLNSAGYKLDDLASISILSRDASNRIEKLELRDKAGAIMIVTAKDFRMILDPNTIRSANFEIEIKGGNAVINGLGWGHGVGMCQWGAYGMARAGKKTGQILKFYYPGAEIKKIDAIRDKL
jgi:stage II sporulation protein D